MSWQKRARFGFAIFGVAFAVIVFFAIREREKPVAAAAPVRVDPKAILESKGSVLQRITGTREDFTIAAETQLTYDNNATTLINVRAEVKNRDGRDFIVTSREMQAGEKQRDLHFTGEVKLAASDGFEVLSDRASFSESDGLVRAPGALTFKKGLMSGTGVGMSYDKHNDVLVILDQAHVRMTDEGGNTTSEFSAGGATLSRNDDVLLLERTVHALRGEQTMDTETATARLTANEEHITFVELRGSARVAGGSSAFDAMSARDIDLDYSDDGAVLEKVVLRGGGAIALKGRSPSTSPGAGGTAGRQMLGDTLAVTLAPDGAVTSAIGRNNTQLDLPAANGATARHVRARMLDAAGEPGKGMTSARFTDDVEYREDAVKDAPARVAKSRALTVTLDGDTLTSAIFTGNVTFSEQPLTAAAAEARYEPDKGVLRLKGVDRGGRPSVADDKVAMDGDAIDVTLEGRRMQATGNVRTTLQGSAKMPGLLKKEQPIIVTAASLRYTGASGLAIYTGSAQLMQGETALRGDSLAIDQEKGSLLASGAASSSLALGESASIGRADEIRYEDATRQVAYTTAIAVVTPVPPAAAKRPLAHLSGPQGDLRANRIVVTLKRSDGKMERLDASGTVSLRIDTRQATGARLAYFVQDERYELSGSPGIPVKVMEPPCRETTGTTVTFFKSTDRIIVDGAEERRTQTKSGGGPCPEPRPR